MPQLDRWFSTSPSSSSLFGPTCGPRRKSKNPSLKVLSCKKCYWKWHHVYCHRQILWAHFLPPFILQLTRDLDKQREGSASNIARKKQEAESAVSIPLAHVWPCYHIVVHRQIRDAGLVPEILVTSSDEWAEMGCNVLLRSISVIHMIWNLFFCVCLLPSFPPPASFPL